MDQEHNKSISHQNKYVDNLSYLKQRSNNLEQSDIPAILPIIDLQDTSQKFLVDGRQKQTNSIQDSKQKMNIELNKYHSEQLIYEGGQEEKQQISAKQKSTQSIKRTTTIKRRTLINTQTNISPIQQQEHMSQSSIDLSEFHSNPANKKLIKKQKQNYRPQYFNENEWDNLPIEIEELENNTHEEIRRALPKRMHTLIMQKTNLSNDGSGLNLQKGQNISQNTIQQKKDSQQFYQKGGTLLEDDYDKDRVKNSSIQYHQGLVNQNNLQNTPPSQKLYMPKMNSEVLLKEQYRNSFPSEQIQSEKEVYNSSKKKISLINRQTIDAETIVKQGSLNFKQNTDLQSQKIKSILNEPFQKNNQIENNYKSSTSDIRIIGENELDEQNKVQSQNKVTNANNLKSQETIVPEQITIKESINLIRRWIFITFEDPSYSIIAKIICIFMQTMIVLSCIIFILNSVYLTEESEQKFTDNIDFDHDQEDQQNENTSEQHSSTNKQQDTETTSDFQYNYGIFQMYGEFIVSVIFTVDLILRVICCGSFGIPIKTYIKNTVNLIDLISITPFFVSLIFNFTHLKSLNILRVVRLLRLVRIFKLSKYIKGIYILQKAISRAYKQLLFVLNLVFIIALFASTVIYYLEKYYQHTGLDDSNEKYQIQTIPQSLWFTLVTMTTVGYGDKYPLTVPGKTVSICVAFIGNSFMIGLPIAIISHDFQAVYKEEREKEKLNKIKMQSIKKFKSSIQRKSTQQGGSHYNNTTIHSPVYSQTTGVIDRLGINQCSPQSYKNNLLNQITNQNQRQSNEKVEMPFAQLPANNQFTTQKQNVLSKSNNQHYFAKQQTSSITNSPIISTNLNQENIQNEKIQNNQENMNQFQPTNVGINSDVGIQNQDENILYPRTDPSELFDTQKQIMQGQSNMQQISKNNIQQQHNNIIDSQQSNQHLQPHINRVNINKIYHIQSGVQNSSPSKYSSKSDFIENDQQITNQQYQVQSNEQDNNQNYQISLFSKIPIEQKDSIKSEYRTSFKTQNLNENLESQDDKNSKNPESHINNHEDIHEDHEYQAQIEYMANRLKQISRTNKIIRELTIRISKMSYIVTLDIAHLYHTFSQEKAHNITQDPMNSNTKDIVNLASKCERINSPLLKQRVNQIIAFQRSIHNMRQGTKISVDQFTQLNQGGLSRGNSIVTSNSQLEAPQKYYQPSERNIKGTQRPSQYFLQAKIQKKSIFEDNMIKEKESDFDNIQLPTEREEDEEMGDLKKSYNSLKQSLSDLIDFDMNNTNTKSINRIKQNKNGTKSEFFKQHRRNSQLNDSSMNGLTQFQNHYNDQQINRRRDSTLSCHSENLSDIIIQEGTRFKHIQHHLDVQNSNLSISSIEQQSHYNDIGDKIYQQIETEFSPDKVYTDKKFHLFSSQDQNTPHFNQSKMKGLHNTHLNVNQLVSPNNKQKMSLIQDSIFKFKSIQQSQNSEYTPKNQIELSYFNSPYNQQKQEIDSYTQSFNEIKQSQYKMAQGGSQSSFRKYQQFLMQNKRNSLENSSQNYNKENTNTSITDSGIIQNNIQSADIINPVFSTKLRQFVKQREKSNFSSYKEDFGSIQIENDNQNGIISTQNKENDYNAMNIYSLQHLKKSSSQVKNIIQDLILNVSMDLQEQTQNYKNKRQSLYNIEIPSKILKILNQDYDRQYSKRSFNQIYLDISPKSQFNQYEFEKQNKNNNNNTFQSRIKSLETNSPTASSQNFELMQKISKSPSNKNINQFAFKKKQQLFKKNSLNIPIQTQKKQIQHQNSDLSYGGSPSNKLTTLSNQIRSFQSLQQYQS